MSDELARCIGKAARTARYRAKLTQADVAELVGLASEVYSRLERGVMRPSVETLRKLSLALGVSVDELLGLNAEDGGAVRQPLTDGVPPELRRLVRRARDLKPVQRRLIEMIAGALVEKQGSRHGEQ